MCGGALGPLSRLRLTVVSTTFSTLKPLQLLLPHATPCTWLGTMSESVYLNKCLRLLYRSMGLSSPLPIPAWLEFLRCPPSYLSVRYGYRTLSKMIATGDKGLYKCFLKPCLVSSSPYTINTQYILYCWLTWWAWFLLDRHCLSQDDQLKTTIRGRSLQLENSIT